MAGAAESSVLIHSRIKGKKTLEIMCLLKLNAQLQGELFSSETTSPSPSQIVSPSRGKYSNIGVCKGRSPSSHHIPFASLGFRGSLVESISYYIKDYVCSEFTRKLVSVLIALVFQWDLCLGSRSISQTESKLASLNSVL